MITSHISSISFKKLYSLLIIAGLILLLTVFLVPQKASAQHVPVRDAELIAAFKLFLESSVGFAGGGTYFDVDGNAVEIAAEVCSTTTLPGSIKTTINPVDGTSKEDWYSGKETYFGIDIDGDGIINDDEKSIYKEDWIFTDLDGDGTKEWSEKAEPIRQGGDVYYTRSQRDDRVREAPPLGPIEDPSHVDYYKNPQNPYFFLPNQDEMSPSHV